MKVALIAMLCHAANAAYCASIGDLSQPTWDDAPDWQKQSAINGVNMHLANPDATPEMSHAAWMAQKEAEGWTYGEVKDAEKKTHPCFMPYDQLPPEQKAKDYIFRGIVHACRNMPDESVKVVTARSTDGATPVKYVGRRASYMENAYGSKLVFTTGETKLVPAELAAKLLMHPDVYVLGDVTTSPGFVLEEAASKPSTEQDQEGTLQDIRDAINIMDKDALEQFARFHFKVDIDKRRSATHLRQLVTQMVDQYGVAQ